MTNTIITETVTKGAQILKVIRPEEEDSLGIEDLLSYVEDERGGLNDILIKTGAILFRGFGIRDADDFLKIKMKFAGGSSFDYKDGNSPRTKISPNIYTSTEYPKEYRISLHSELSYSTHWPRLIFFYCKIAAAKGGETPILDCRHILKELPASLVENFERYGVKYTRYLAGSKGIGKTWMDTFETQDRKAIEEYCMDNNIEFLWENGSLCLGQYGKGIAEHPVTGEKVWFNQANQFHPSGLPDDIYRALQLMHSKNKHRYPQNAFWGNGEELPEKGLRDITEMQFDCAMTFPWAKGDVLMLDNMLMAHGRMAFEGDRKVYVSMC